MGARTFLEALGLDRYAAAFEENDIDESVLGTLTDADLLTLGVASLGHRKKILQKVAERASSRTADGGSAGAPRPGESSAATPPTQDVGAVVVGGVPPSLTRALGARGYVLVDRIGRGGMGEVFLARQPSVGRDVAVKVLTSRGTEAERSRFAREARAVAALQHPHVVRLFDYVLADDGSACIVMEHVVGRSVGALYEHEGRVAFDRLIPILMQICDALSEAHAKGIVHRDLKPANVLLQDAEGYRDFARVLDFGLAQWTSEVGSRLTRTGAIHGTPRYLSPEQIVGTNIGPRSDLYALGVMLYEGLAGRPPFVGDLDAALLFHHLKDPPPALPDDVERPRALDALLTRMLAKSPTLRPASAAALRRELAAMVRAPSGASVVDAAAPTSGPVTERRRVVVLDVSFLDRSQGPASADHAHALARRGLALIESIARRSGGTITARGASGAQLVYGAPVARDNDLDRAFDSALELRSALNVLDTEHVRVRIGVADGAAVSGGLRDGRDAGYFVSGPPVDAAEALRAGAGPGEIRVARSIASRRPGQWALDEAEGDGRGALLLARAASTTTLEQPFVGREAELGTIASVLDGVGPGSTGAVVVVSGEAGIGKSRLLDRLVSLATSRSMRSVRGLLFDVEVASGEDALHQIVRALLALPDDASDRIAALERRLGPDALRAEEWPFLYHYVGIALPGPMQRVYDAMDPSARSSGYRDMLVSLLSHESRAQPLVVAIEDLHWADVAMLEVLELIAAQTKFHPIVLVLTSRVEDEARWSDMLSGHAPTRIELGPLPAADAGVLAMLLGLADTGVRSAVVERASGHPLLITELARHDALGDTALIPDTLQGLVHARVDRLPEADRSALATAAVLGPRFTLVQLREMLGEPEYRPAALEEHRLVRRHVDGTWAFAHALVKDAIYGSLVDERRRALHERAAACTHEAPALVAMHLDRAGSPRAAGAYLAAALGEIERHELLAAREHLARGVAVASTPADRLELESARGGVELALGDSAAALSSFEAARALCTAPADVLRAELGLASTLRVANRWDDALAALDRAEASAGGAPGAIAQARYLRGGIEFARGRVAESQKAHEEALALATEAGAIELRTQALSGLADAHYGAGRLVTAARTWAECVAIARAHKLLAVEAANLPMLAIVRVFLNEAERASATADEAIALAQSLSRTRSEAIGRGGAALAANARGEYEAARLHATRGLELTKKLGHIAFEETVLYYLAIAQLGLGERDAARGSVERALGLAREHGMQFVGATLLALRARFEPDAKARAALLSEGETLALAGTLSFDRFWFFQNAIEAALEAGDLGCVRRWADEIERTEEPLPWAQTVAARGRALAEHRSGRRDPAARAALALALEGCRRAGLEPDAVALEEALRETEP